MNQNPQDDSLDNLLHQWANERSARASHIDHLQDRILSAIRDDTLSNAEPVSATHNFSVSSMEPETLLPYRSRPVSLRRASLVGTLIGATLIALVAFIWTTQLAGVGRDKGQLADDGRSKIPEYAQLSDSQLSSRINVLSEMKVVFGDQLNWLAETDSCFEVGLSENSWAGESSRSQNEAVEIAVRVVVEERSSPDGAWQRTWAADVISKNEEVVEFAAKNNDCTTMTMWAFVLPDGTVAIDSELKFSEGSPATTTAETAQFRATFSKVQKDRQPSEELLTGANGIEYRVFQTVAVLNKKVG